MGGLIDVTDEYAQRDVYAMEEWATNYGVQKVETQLYSEDGADYQLVSQAQIPAGSTAIFVPAGVCLSSNAVVDEYGGSLQQAEQVLVQMDQGTQRRLPLFRLMVKVLAEYEKGQDSPFFPWLNSLPRQFYNGVSMTDACFNCLPPYAGWLTSNERINYSHFVNALRQGFVPLSPEVVNNDAVVKWAYNVAFTRFHEVWEPTRQKLIAPMADMLNHSSEPNCEITFDQQGNCNVNALYDIQPGTPLTVSLGDPTNPTPIFAQYGFLPNDCATIFCKAMHLEPQIKDLGYDFKDLLFQTQSGEIAPKVWDIFLYKILQENDQGAADEFYVACKTNDEGTKQGYHDNYFAYTLDALKQHVYKILADVENMNMKAQSYDLQTHPRVPVILAHNNLVRDTFTMTAALLEQMG
eukprot:CAMPEP_0183734462 /NCGR_PEP_ID=MMETSP0737-20130205/43878_1 /TAXON_ID=385413 /ORGANISM="Thalassiosira miniscula, Strain CCMP1093" /LENGTH=407 /DNA_ID=CAMNT_0025967955 /DNA_START=211 /DNA_END=1434 /DNA_ORIENTATION=+